VSGSATVFLAVIAVSTFVMALIQVGFVVYAARLGRRVERLSERVERDIRPLLTHLETVGSNAAQASRLAVRQVERADRAVADVTERLDRAMTGLQAALVAPIREGRAIAVAVRAGVVALVNLRHEARVRAHRVEEDDPLFIG